MSSAASKTVHVQYFAAFREHAGVEKESVETEAATAGELFETLSKRHGSSEPRGHCKVAINEEMSTWDDPLADGDTVLLFPPVGGG